MRIHLHEEYICSVKCYEVFGRDVCPFQLSKYSLVSSLLDIYTPSIHYR